jgi:hypothetical protein
MAVTIASTTSSQEELNHAASENWREPFVPAAEEKLEEASAVAPPVEEAPTEDPSAQPRKKHTGPFGNKGWSKRVDKLTARAKSLEHENRQLRERFATLPVASEIAAEEARERSQREPNPNQQAETSQPNQAAEPSPEQQRPLPDDEVKRFRSHFARMNEALRNQPDRAELIQRAAQLRIEPHVRVGIVSQDNSEAIAIHLARNPEFLNELNGMGTARAMAEIGRLSDGLAPEPPDPVLQAQKDSYNEGVSQFSAKAADFRNVVAASTAEIPESVHEAIIRAGAEGPPLAYALAKNPEECQKLVKAMERGGDHAAILELGRFADRITRPQQRATPPPPPIRPVAGTSTRSSIPLEEMSIKEFMRVRNHQEYQKKHGR